MYSLDNLFKLNDLKDKHENFDELTPEQLKSYLNKYRSLVGNAKIINSLPDKGEKLKKQLTHIEVS